MILDSNGGPIFHPQLLTVQRSQLRQLHIVPQGLDLQWLDGADLVNPTFWVPILQKPGHCKMNVADIMHRTPGQLAFYSYLMRPPLSSQS